MGTASRPEHFFASVRYSGMDLRRLLRIDPEDWQLAAACRGRQEIFFTPDEFAESRVDRRRREGRAKAICGTCQVRIECLTEAMQSEERFGVWGGLTERERKALLRHPHKSPQDIAGPGRPTRLPAVVVQGRPMSSN